MYELSEITYLKRWFKKNVLILFLLSRLAFTSFLWPPHDLSTELKSSSDTRSVSVCSNFNPVDEDYHIRSWAELIPSLTSQVHRVTHGGGGMAGVDTNLQRPLSLYNIRFVTEDTLFSNIKWSDLYSSTSDSWALYKRLISFFAAHKNSSNKC